MKHVVDTFDIGRLTSGLLALGARAQALPNAPRPPRADKPARVVEEKPHMQASRGTNYPSQTDMARSHVLLLQDRMVGELEKPTPDWNRVEKLGKAIVTSSTHLREISLIENRPAPPRFEPITSDVDAAEDRVYAGVGAKELSFTVKLLVRLKNIIGVKQVKARLARLPRKILKGLRAYVQVKQLVARREDAVDHPETAIAPSRGIAKPEVSRETFRWRVSPQAHYNWKISYGVNGYDVRRTSLYWLRRESAKIRKEVEIRAQA